MYRRTLVRTLATLTVLIPASAGATLPERVGGTYYGGPGTDTAFGSAVDGAGNLYLCGGTSSGDARSIRHVAR